MTQEVLSARGSSTPGKKRGWLVGRWFGGLVQLVRTADSKSVCRAFESRSPRYRAKETPGGIFLGV